MGGQSPGCWEGTAVAGGEVYWLCEVRADPGCLSAAGQQARRPWGSLVWGPPGSEKRRCGQLLPASPSSTRLGPGPCPGGGDSCAWVSGVNKELPGENCLGSGGGRATSQLSCLTVNSAVGTGRFSGAGEARGVWVAPSVCPQFSLP